MRKYWPWLLGLVHATVFLAFRFEVPHWNLDTSHKMAAVDALTRGLVMGRDIDFTFGPLGFLYGRMYDPRTLPYLLAFQVSLALAFTLLWRSLAKAAGATPLAVFTIASLAAFSLMKVHLDSVGYALSALFLCATFAGQPSALELLGAAVVLALVALSKFSLFTAAVAAVAAGVLLLPLRRRPTSAIWVGLGFAVPCFAIWRLRSDGIGDMAASVRHYLELSAGYTEAMASEGAYGQMAVFAVCVFFVVWPMSNDVSTSRSERRVFQAALLVLMWLVFKATFVRHAGVPEAPLFVAGGLFVARFGVAPLARRPLLATYLALITAAVLGGEAFLKRPSLEFDEWHPRLTSYPQLDSYREAGLRSIVEMHPLQGVTGTADVYPFDVAAVLARPDLRWAPRPVIQSYSAYTPLLIDRNVEHLRKAPPEWLLFDVLTIDQRYPSLDDGPSWPEVLARYDLVDGGTRPMLLHKRDKADVVTRRPLREVLLRMGEPIGVEPGRVWVELDLQLTIAGKLRAFLQELPPVFILVKTRDGLERRHRLVRAMAQRGFLLSPRVATANQFLELWRDEGLLTAMEVESFRVEAPDDARGWWYRRDGVARFSRLDVPPRQAPVLTGSVVTPVGSLTRAHDTDVTATASGLRLLPKTRSAFVVLGDIAPSAQSTLHRIGIVVDLTRPARIQIMYRRREDAFTWQLVHDYELPAGRSELPFVAPIGGTPIVVRLNIDDPALDTASPAPIVLGGLRLERALPGVDTVDAAAREQAAVLEPFVTQWRAGLEPLEEWDADVLSGFDPLLSFHPLLPADSARLAALQCRPQLRIASAVGTRVELPWLAAETTDPWIVFEPIEPSTPGSPRLLQVAMQTSVPTHVQLFQRPMSGENSEASSRHYYLTPGAHVLAAPVPAGPEPIELRMDYADAPGTVSLLAATIAGPCSR